jgi:adenosylhomocysteine nucleosidase
MVLEKYSLSMVISIGYAGGTHSDIQAGDLLVARQFLNFSKDGEPPQKIDVPFCLAEQAEKVPPSKKYSAFKGSLLTMDQVINKPEDKRAIGEDYGANAIDMETSILAHLAAAKKVPFLSVRAITDTVDEELIDVSSFMENDGQVSTLKAGWYVLTHPGKIPKFISLQEIAQRGTKNITEFLIAFLKLVD